MLGNVAEAEKELANLSPDLRAHPDVMQLQWQLFAQRKQWQACLDTASAIVKIAPMRPFGWIHRSFSLHELKRTQEAYDQLLPMTRRFARIATIHYNLACYSCQLGKLEEAWTWLQKAMKILQPGKLKSMALEDEDLQPLWPRIRELPLSDAG